METPINPEQPVLPPDIQPRKSHTGLHLTLAIIVTAIIVGGGVYTWKQRTINHIPNSQPTPTVSEPIADLAIFTPENSNVSLMYPKKWGELREYGQYSYQFYDTNNDRKSNFIDIRNLPPTPTIEYEPYLGDYVGDIAFSVENKKISLCTAINQKAVILGAIIKDCKEGTVNGLTFADFMLNAKGVNNEWYNYQSRIYLTNNKTNPGLFISLFAPTTPNGFQEFLKSAHTTQAPADTLNQKETSNWKTYKDTNLSISISYPSDKYSATPLPSDDYIQFGDRRIAIEGVRVSDGIPEGNGIQLYRTNDSRILNYLQQYKSFTGEKVVNGIKYQQFEFAGMGDVYGYETEKNDQYYVLASTWGPNNPITERMLASLVFDTN